MRLRGGFKQRIALGVICLLVFSYTVYHVIAIFGEDISTYAAGVTTESTTMSYNGYIFRDEKVLSSDNEGIVEYLVTDGTKVSEGQKVAVVYEENRKDQDYVAKVDEYIRVLEASNKNVSVGADIVQQRGQNADTYDAIIKLLASGESGGLDYQAEKLLVGMNTEKAIANGGVSSNKKTLDALYAERQRIFDVAGDGETCSVSKPGYFFSGSDGCEDLFTVSAIEDLTLDSFSDIIDEMAESRADNGAYGRIAFDSLWNIVLVVDNGDLKHFKVGDTYSALFSENNSTDMPLTLEKIVRDSGYDVSLLVFSCNRQPENFSFERCQSVTITAEEISGIYVPKNVVVREEGVKGVYILRGSIVYFRYIEVVYEGSDYYLVRKDSEHDGERLFLRENDMIILNGYNLFDGRVLD